MMKSLANPAPPKPRAAPPAAAPARCGQAARRAGGKPPPRARAAKPADDAPLEFTPAAKPPPADDIPPTIEYRPEPKKK